MPRKKVEKPPAKRGPKFKFGDKEKIAFLDQLVMHGNFSRACRALAMKPRNIYKHKEIDPEFAKSIEEAQEMFADSLEEELIRRGMEGDKETIYYNGVPVGTKVNKSDRLLEKAVMAHKRKKYSAQTSMTVEGEVTHQHTHKQIKASIMDKLDILAGAREEAVDAELVLPNDQLEEPKRAKKSKVPVTIDIDPTEPDKP